MAKRQSGKPKPRTKGPKLDTLQIVLKPLITEKGTHLVERHNTYVFQVNPYATKTEIKNAVEELFDVHVVGVRTCNQVGKVRQYRRRYFGKTSSWKKAYVQLSENDRIALF